MSFSHSFSPASSTFVVGALVAVTFSIASQAATTVSYDIRAVTNDKVTTFLGAAKQGSFGAPTLNDKGSIAYPCILFGNNVDAFTNSSIVFRKSGKKYKAAAAVQAGVSLNDSFLPFYNEKNTYGVPGSAAIYKISKAIAINNKDQVGFSAEVLNTVRTDTFQMGTFTNAAFRADDRSDYGVVYPSSTAPGGFQNARLSIYESYSADILQRTLSINSYGSVPENAVYKITATRTVPGFDYEYPIGLSSYIYIDPADPMATEQTFPTYITGGSIVATTESNVIGLPYETVFSTFSDAIIADKNRIFVVADLSDTGAEFDGIWQGTNPNLQPIVVKQTKAPGGGVYSSFDGKVGPNRKGTSAAFIANLTGTETGNRAVFRSNLKGTQVDRIASVGDKAPGTTSTFSDFQLAAVSNRGYVAILGSTAGQATGFSGIWISDPTGKNLRLIAISGQKMQISNKTKTVTRLAFNPVAGINTKGQVAFTASFTDKTSAVIVAK